MPQCWTLILVNLTAIFISSACNEINEYCCPQVRTLWWPPATALWAVCALVLVSLRGTWETFMVLSKPTSPESAQDASLLKLNQWGNHSENSITMECTLTCRPLLRICALVGENSEWPLVGQGDVVGWIWSCSNMLIWSMASPRTFSWFAFYICLNAVLLFQYCCHQIGYSR
jgi:hypothetical protein